MLQGTQSRVSARRSQAERREGTRTLLLEAAVGSMTERGYAATTTLEVERRAGVSRGARIHYFPTKADLLTAAVDHLYDRLGEPYGEMLAALGTGRDDAERAADALRQLWAVYQQPEYIAALDLHVAARTDAELRQRLIIVRERQRQILLKAVLAAFPELSRADAGNLIEACVASMLGLLIQRDLGLPREVEDFVLGQLGILVVQHLASAVRGE